MRENFTVRLFNSWILATEHLKNVLGNELLYASVDFEASIERQYYLDICCLPLIRIFASERRQYSVKPEGTILLYKIAHFSGNKGNVKEAMNLLLSKGRYPDLVHLCDELIPWLSPLSPWEVIWFLRLIRKRLQFLIYTKSMFNFPKQYFLNCTCDACELVNSYLSKDIEDMI